MATLEERIEILETRLRGKDNITQDHGELGGLTDDDHEDYHNNTKGDVRYIKKDGSTADISADISLNSNKLTGVKDPTANQNVATKKYANETQGSFGGTGADGAKTVDGNENLDFDSANVLIKNYTSLIIDATYAFGAINVPATGGVMYIKVSGDCEINGKIDMKGQGGDKGIGGTTGSHNGTDGTQGYKAGMDDNTHYGGGGTSGYTGDQTVGAGGAGGGHQSAGADGNESSTPGAGDKGIGGLAIRGCDEYIDQNLNALFFFVGSGGGGGGFGIGVDPNNIEYSSGDGGNGGAGDYYIIKNIQFT